MSVNTRTMNDLKDEILSKVDDKFSEFKLDILAELKQQLKIEVAEAFKNELKIREELESTVSVLQQHVKICQKQITGMQQANEELEQYGRRLCVRIDGVPTVDNETSDEVLDKVKSLIKETSCDIPDVVIDRAHRIGKGYNDRKTNVRCKSIIVPFTTFRHRAMFYRSGANLKSNVKLKLDLTENRYKTFTKAIETVKSYDNVNYVMVDLNCRLKVVLKDGSSKFFTEIMSLKEILEREGTNQV